MAKDDSKKNNDKTDDEEFKKALKEIAGDKTKNKDNEKGPRRDIGPRQEADLGPRRDIGG